MKMKLHIIVIGLFITIAGAHSQISLNKVLKNVKKNAEKQIEQRIERKADKAVDKTLDKAEEGIDNTVKNVGKKKDEDKESKDKNISTENEQEKQETPTVEKASPVLTWNKYDFVPGTEIIFEDNQEGEQNGEFPSKWDLVEGEFENASFDGGNVIYHIRCNMNGGGGIVPLLKNAKEDYLPEEFTIEFDAYFNEQIAGNYHIYFLDFKNQKNLDKTVSYVKKYIRIYKNSVDGSGIVQINF
jgi:hypothetical protein